MRPALGLNVNGELLALAREREGLTQSEVADRASVTQATVSRVESGALRQLTDEALARIASVVDVPVSFLTWFPPVRHLGFHRLFRFQRKVGARDLARIEANINARRLHLIEVLRRFAVSASMPMPSPDTYAEFEPAEAARALRRLWSLRPGPIVNLTRLLESAGILVVEVSDLPPEFGGLAIHAYGAMPMIFVPVGQPDDRRRLTLAHELAHLLLHQKAVEKQEDEAYEFAQEFLFPEAEARARLSAFDLSSAIRVKGEYRISLQAIAMRAGSLQLISPLEKQKFFKMMSARGWRREEPGTLRPEAVSVVPELVRRLIADFGGSAERTAEFLRESPRRVREYYLPEVGGGLSLMK